VAMLARARSHEERIITPRRHRTKSWSPPASREISSGLLTNGRARRRIKKLMERQIVSGSGVPTARIIGQVYTAIPLHIRVLLVGR
jgi:hypothetical protein